LTRKRKLAFVFLSIIGLFVMMFLALCVSVPDVEQLAHENPMRSNYMPAQTTLGEWTRLESMSPWLPCVVVIAEDFFFFDHHGFDWAQLRRALWSNLTGGSGFGGSTITQQLARNLYLSPERSLIRKLREAFIARSLERHLRKARILEVYLNIIEYADGVWGIGAATRYYFQKTPAEVTLPEALFLASIIPAPRAALVGRNLERSLKIRDRVIWLMQRRGLLTPSARQQAHAGIAVTPWFSVQQSLAGACRFSAVSPSARN
jgi:monofunctional biosynthetic peptidoglycan transglycosylase